RDRASGFRTRPGCRSSPCRRCPSDRAPARPRGDPGEVFPWARLAAAGIGLAVEAGPIVAGAMLQSGGVRGEGAKLQRAVGDFGYGVAETGMYDTATEEAVTAFQRHFRPARVDGIADVSTMRALRKVVAQKSKG